MTQNPEISAFIQYVEKLAMHMDPATLQPEESFVAECLQYGLDEQKSRATWAWSTARTEAIYKLCTDTLSTEWESLSPSQFESRKAEFMQARDLHLSGVEVPLNQLIVTH